MFTKRTILMLMIAAAALAGRAQQSENDVKGLDSRISQYVGAGMTVSGIRYPLYEEDGSTLQALFYIGQAEVMGTHQVVITDLKIEVYEEGAVVATVYAPACVSDMNLSPSGEKNRTVTVKSDGLVLVESDDVSMTGRGFVWRLDGRKVRFEIFNDSRVLVKASAEKLQELNR